MTTRTDDKGNPLPERMHYRQGRYYHVRRVTGKPKWTPLGDAYVAAIGKWAQIEGAGESALTVAQAIESYLLDGAARLRPTTLRNYRNQADHINDVWGAMALADVTRPDVREWLHAHSSVYAANRKLALFKAALNYAVEKGWLAENPARGVRRLTGEQPRTRIATREEIVKLGDIATPMWRAIISVELLTGMRPADLRTLMRSQLQDDGIPVRQSKTGHRVTYEWTPGLRLAIDMALQAQRVPSLYVFPARGNGPYTADGFKTVWHKLRAAAGIHGLQFRDLRRTAGVFASDLEAARALLGHTDSRITSRVYRPDERAKPNK